MRLFALLLGLVLNAGLIYDHAQAQTTCSAQRDGCRNATAGRSQRGVPWSGCEVAHAECMKSGVWDTRGGRGHGTRKTGLIKK
jgi:hypothetical protein